MNVFTRVCLLAALVTAAASPAFAQATIHGDLTKDWAGQKALLVGLANAMPEDKYGFKPTPVQRSFGPSTVNFTPALCSSSAIARTVFCARGSNAPAHPTQNSTSRPSSADAAGMSSPFAQSSR